MRYHWEFLNGDQVALFEEGSGWTGSLPAMGVVVAINKMGPYLGSEKVVYKVTGSLVEEPKDFESLQEAMQYIERNVGGAGDSVDRR
jgi:hypothetical protein